MGIPLKQSCPYGGGMLGGSDHSGASWTDSQRQLLSLIRDFASERSKGGRRISDLKRRLQDLRAEYESACADLDDSKKCKDEAEEGLKGSEVELSMADASILVTQARCGSLQVGISKIGDDIASLQNEGGIIRDEFISVMFDFNREIRKLNETMKKQKSNGTSSIKSINGEGFSEKKLLPNSEDVLEKLRFEITSINSQVTVTEMEYNNALAAHNELIQMHSNIERKVSLAESIMKEMKELQEIGQKSNKAEQVFAHMGEELKKRYTCKSCGHSGLEEHA